jgi:hypothetical protein
MARDCRISSSKAREADSMRDMNVFAAWFAILAGLLSGTTMGLFFHNPDWMGGYESWRRRMLRLGHISFFGTGFLNLAFVLSVEHFHRAAPPAASAGFLLGAVFMPLVCFLSAWRESFRRFFFIPVASLIVAASDLLIWGLWR